jgi:hypothetical protein
MSQQLTLLLLNNWRAIVTDSKKGILVLDLEASNEAEAKGRARTAAETHLGATDVQNVIVCKHVDMNPAWLRMKQSTKAH